MSGKRCALLVVVLCAISAGAVLAKDDGNGASYQVIRDSSGAVKLRVTADVPASGMWLGVTLYPKGVKVGSSQTVPLKWGHNSNDITIAPSLSNGTFEAAVWSKKLSKEECDPGDEACRKNGGKLTGMISYLWGYLN